MRVVWSFSFLGGNISPYNCNYYRLKRSYLQDNGWKIQEQPEHKTCRRFMVPTVIMVSLTLQKALVTF